MSAVPALIPATFHEKVWGRERHGIRLGEIWCRAEPLLLKFIFTSEKLSVQVHPGDEYALLRDKSAGKTECWHIMAAEPGARLAIDFRRPLTREQIEEAIRAKTIEQELNWIEVKAGDFIFVPWGTVHAIGAGLTLCEVQEFSDVTYRLFDYGRPRELHLEKGLDVVRHHPSAGLMEPVRLADRDFLIACRYFAIERVTCSTEYAAAVDPARFEVLIVLRGEGEIVSGGCRQPYTTEQMWLLPAGLKEYRVAPHAETIFLKAYAPPSLSAIRSTLAQAGASETDLNRVIISNL